MPKVHVKEWCDLMDTWNVRCEMQENQINFHEELKPILMLTVGSLQYQLQI